MQILKDDVKEAILKAAGKHFSTNGYLAASLRDIARDAGLSVGNLYRYFSGKEDIFAALVHPVYLKLVNIIQNEMHGGVSAPHSITLEDFFKIIVVIAEQLGEYREEILILVNGAGGSKYQNAKYDFTAHLEEHIKGHFNEYKEKTGIQIDSVIAKAYAVSIIEGYIEILKNCEKTDELKNMIVTFTAVIVNGFKEYI